MVFADANNCTKQLRLNKSREKRLKYIEHLRQIQNCPPVAYKQVDMVAFRFVFDGSNIEKNFSPRAILEPHFLKQLKGSQKCKSYGLSFFSTKENAEAKFHTLKKHAPKIGKKYGDTLAEVEIKPAHGVANQPNGDGHFTVHEAAGATWEWTKVKTL